MADTKISGLSSASAVADTDIIPIVSGGVNYKATRASLFTGTVTLLTNGASNKGLIIQGALGQTANIQECQNSVGTALTCISSGGRMAINASGTTLISNTTNFTSGYFGFMVGGSSGSFAVRDSGDQIVFGTTSLGANTDGRIQASTITFTDYNTSIVKINCTTGHTSIGSTTDSAQLYVVADANTTKGLIVQGASSQSANIQEWQNSSGVVKLSANFNGTSAHGRLVIATGGYSDNGLIITSDAATGGGSASGTISYSTSDYFTFSKPIGYTIAIEMSSGRQWINNNTSSGITFESQATATGQVAYIFTTQNSLSTSSLLSFRNSGTEVVGVASSGAVTITSASASSFVVGANGTTNPVFRVVGNVSSAATGLSITGNAAGSGVTLTALSSGTNEYISLNPKGTSYTIFSGSAAISASGSTSFFGGGWWNGSNLTALSNDPSTIEFSNQTIIFRIAGGVTAGTTYSGGIPLTISNSFGVSVTTTLFANSTVGLASSSVLRFSSDSNGYGTADLSLTRNSASILKIGNAGSGLGAVICGQPTTSIIGLTVKQATLGTANLQEWQNSSGTALATVTKDGYITAPQISSGGTTPLLIPSHSTTLTTDSDAATITFNLATSNDHLVVLGGNRTLALSNDQTGQKFSIILQQDATGSRTVTWWSGISWSGGSAPTLTTTANKNDVFTFWKIGVGSYLGFITGQNL